MTAIHHLKVAGASLNQTPLDWQGNRANIVEAIRMARTEGVQVLCLPELCVSGYGCEVTVASDGTTAINQLAEASFDLVLSDIKMPGKSGYDVFAAAKNANAKTPVILMTGFGYDPNHTIVRARREGLAAVLFKPFKVDQLLSEVRTALTSVEK